MGHYRCLTARLVTPWLTIRHGAQTDSRRFSSPSDHHLRKITEAPVSASARADGMRWKWWWLTTPAVH